MTQLLVFFSSYLIEFMALLLITALSLRYLAYRASNSDQMFFSAFTRELEFNVEKDKQHHTKIDSIDEYLDDILARVSRNLPARTLRAKKKERVQDKKEQEKKVLSLQEYVSGSQGLVGSIKSENSVFVHKTPPNFTELTNRIMSQDENWSKLLGHIPIDGIVRIIDILPGLFIIFGVFGTFIGISMALPEIAKIDFNNLDGAGAVLSTFVQNVTFAMKTSIAGIFFSITLTLLNALFPIKAVRYAIFKKVEQSFQTLWYHIHNEASIEQNLLNTFTEISTVIKEIRDNLTTREGKNKEVS